MSAEMVYWVAIAKGVAGGLAIGGTIGGAILLANWIAWKLPLPKSRDGAKYTL